MCPASSDSRPRDIVFFNGEWQRIGGTSAASPLWAALTAVANQGCAASAGSQTPALCTPGPGTSPPFNDITVGNNDLFDPCPRVRATRRPRYDLASGWGPEGPPVAQRVHRSSGGCPRVTSVSPSSGPAVRWPHRGRPGGADSVPGAHGPLWFRGKPGYGSPPPRDAGHSRWRSAATLHHGEHLAWYGRQGTVRSFRPRRTSSSHPGDLGGTPSRADVGRWVGHTVGSGFSGATSVTFRVDYGPLHRQVAGIPGGPALPGGPVRRGHRGRHRAGSGRDQPPGLRRPVHLRPPRLLDGGLPTIDQAAVIYSWRRYFSSAKASSDDSVYM